MSRFLTCTMAMAAAASSFFAVSRAEASTVQSDKLTLTESSGSNGDPLGPSWALGTGIGTININENFTLGSGNSSHLLSSGSSLSITFSNVGSAYSSKSLTFVDSNLTGDTAYFSGHTLTGIDSPSLGPNEISLTNVGTDDIGRITLVLNLNTGDFSVYDTSGFVKENGSISISATPVPGALSLLVGGAGILGFALMLGRRNKKRDYDQTIGLVAA